MSVGVALSDKEGHFYTEIGIAPIDQTLTIESMRLSEVYKCVDCGHSEPLVAREFFYK
ncbi:hypothetical protein SCRM01_184 [Synechococcus phage S-CRM01]|uniref:hypothetical protein n=1 Tax=Synechococcus phage S-CRM01 TaxID=1026955 RepID=UPI000209E409|nr:hypothetical protein SCRM01_184 [Synechococcus phage S-CRM01]AEC53130.1 hypothetical protein SCRM01_184 [Synechococcus phage S-CRM01]